MTNKIESPFDTTEWAAYYRGSSLERRLSALSSKTQDPRWLERLRAELPPDEIERIEDAIDQSRRKLTAEYLENESLGMTAGMKFLKAFPNPPSTVLSPPEPSAWHRLLPAFHGDCYQTGRRPITTFRDPNHDDIKIDGGSTGTHSIQQNADLPAAVGFSIRLNDVKKWWRVDAPDWIELFREAAFTLPPAPCDGHLSWGTEVSFNNRGFGGAAEFSHLYVGATSAVIADVSNPQAQVSGFESMDSNLLDSNSPTSQDGGPVHFGGHLDVRQGQVTQIYFTIWVRLQCLGGLAHASGSVEFRDPVFTALPQIVPRPDEYQGLRYTFLSQN